MRFILTRVVQCAIARFSGSRAEGFFSSVSTTIGELGEVPSREEGLRCRDGYKEKWEHTGEASEIWVVARIDLGRTRRDATRRATMPCRSLATLRRFFGYAVLLLSVRTIYPSIRVVPFHLDLLTRTNPEVGEFSIKTLIDWSANHLFRLTTKCNTYAG